MTCSLQGTWPHEPWVVAGFTVCTRHEFPPTEWVLRQIRCLLTTTSIKVPPFHLLWYLTFLVITVFFRQQSWMVYWLLFSLGTYCLFSVLRGSLQWLGILLSCSWIPLSPLAEVSSAMGCYFSSGKWPPAMTTAYIALLFFNWGGRSLGLHWPTTQKKFSYAMNIFLLLSSSFLLLLCSLYEFGDSIIIQSCVILLKYMHIYVILSSYK